MELEQKGQTEREKILANKEIERMRAEIEKLKIAADVQIAKMNNATKLHVEAEKMDHAENVAEFNASHDAQRKHEREMRDKEAGEIG